MSGEPGLTGLRSPTDSNPALAYSRMAGVSHVTPRFSRCAPDARAQSITAAKSLRPTPRPLTEV
jgi:hypothetical protein